MDAPLARQVAMACRKTAADPDLIPGGSMREGAGPRWRGCRRLLAACTAGGQVVRLSSVVSLASRPETSFSGASARISADRPLALAALSPAAWMRARTAFQ